MFQDTSRAKDVDSPNLLADFFSSEDLNGDVSDDVVGQVPEDFNVQHLGNHFLAAQTDDLSAEQPPAKKQKLSTAASASLAKSSWVKCDKCHRTIKAEDFQDHFREVHLDSAAGSNANQVNLDEAPTNLKDLYNYWHF